MINAEDIKELRAKTGAGLQDCQKALAESNNNMEKAVEILREKGIATVAKKAGRIAGEGVVGSYIHMGGKIGVLVEVNCETDFVARGELFNTLVKDVAMQIAASRPEYVRIEDVPAEEVAKEKEILIEQAKNEGKPAAIAEKMVDGRIKKFYKEVCLMEQDFVKDPEKTISDLVTEYTLKIGEKITIRRFVRYEMGEGLEKRNDNFAEEVMSQMKK
jgi:elongation factor Ts